MQTLQQCKCSPNLKPHTSLLSHVRLRAEAERIEFNLENAMHPVEDLEQNDDLTEEQKEQKRQELEASKSAEQKLLSGIAPEEDPLKGKKKRKAVPKATQGKPSDTGSGASTGVPSSGIKALTDDMDVASAGSKKQSKHDQLYEELDEEMRKVAAVHLAEAEKLGKNVSVKSFASLRVENFYHDPKLDRSKSNTILSVGC